MRSGFQQSYARYHAVSFQGPGSTGNLPRFTVLCCTSSPHTSARLQQQNVAAKIKQPGQFAKSHNGTGECPSLVWQPPQALWKQAHTPSRAALTHTAPPQHHRYSQLDARSKHKSDNFTVRNTDQDRGLLP